jgi:hypothetical protein
MFLLTDRTPIERYVDSDRIIGTAHSQGKLRVRGTGWIGQQEVDHCPELRRPIISHGRICAWGCRVALPTEGGPDLYKGGDCLCPRYACFFVGGNPKGSQSATGSDDSHGDDEVGDRSSRLT